MKKRRYLYTLIGLTAVLMLILQTVFIFPAKTVKAAGDVTLKIETSASVTTAVPGQTFTYTIKYSNPSTTTNAYNVKIKDVLPAELSYVSLDTSADISSYNVTGNTVTFNFVEELKAGGTGVLKIQAKFKDGVTQDDTKAVDSASIYGDNAPEVVSNEVTVTAKVNAPNWSLAKAKTNPTGTPVVGQPVTYRLRLTGNSSGGLNMQNVTLTDTLPANVQFKSATNSGTYDSGTNTVTWAIGNLNVGSSADRFVTVVYPTENYDSTSTAVNHAGAEGQQYGSSDTLTLTAQCQHGFTEPAPGINGGFSKSNRQSNDEYSIGQTAIFYINNIGNTGNVPLDSYTIEDTIPGSLDLTSFTTGRYSDVVPLTVNYKTNKKTDWTQCYSGNTSTSSATTVRASDLSLDADEYITNVQWVLTTLPTGFSSSSSIQLNGTVREKDRTDTVVTHVVNNATAIWVYGASNGQEDASAAFDIVSEKPWFNPSKSVTPTSTEYNKRITYTLRIKNHDFATGDLVNPVAADVLPDEVQDPEFVSFSAGNSGTSLSPSGTNFTVGSITPVSKTVGGSTKNVLVWRFEGADALTLKPGQYVDIKFSVLVKDQTEVGNISNTFYLSTDATTDIKQASGLVTDTDDLDGDGNTTEKMMAASVNEYVKFLGSLRSQKWVKGALDSDWNCYTDPSTQWGKTVPGGQADYQLHIKNNGSNGPISHIVLIDILPYVGDHGVVDSQARNSQWRPYLVNKITGKDGSGNALPAGVKVYYSTNASPSCEELTDPVNKHGKAADGWSATPPADITTVRAIKIDMGSYVLNADSTEIIFEWPMRAPYGAPTNIFAWNSFGYTATYQDSSGDQSFLPSEPIKVGFEIQDDRAGTVALGNRVWEDLNRNGRQDSGEPGINGVIVQLFREGDDPASATPVAYTRTGDNQSGDPGWYKFPELDAGNYFVTYTYPDTYRAVAENSASEDTDSDLLTATETANGGYRTGQTAVINLTADDMNEDVGLYRVASVGDTVWNDINANGVQDSGEPGVAGAVVSLTDDSGSTVKDVAGADVASKTTGSDGKYSFTNLKPGNYKVHVQPPNTNYVFTGENSGSDDAKDSDVNASGVTDTIELSSNENDTSEDAGLHKGAVGDFVWNDVNANGVQDSGEAAVGSVTVDLLNTGGSVLKTTQTDSSGNYIFTDLDAGQYTIKVHKPTAYGAFTGENSGSDDAKDSDVDATGVSGTITLAAGARDMTWDAGLYKCAVGDTVWADTNANGIQDSGEPGINGVTVTLYKSDNTEVASAVTVKGGPKDSDGYYAFFDLAPGDYYITVDKPSGYDAFSPKDKGTDDAADSDADHEGRADLTLAAGERNWNWDTGLYKAASLGDYVWEDMDENGIQDSGEPAFAGVLVSLTDNDGKDVTDINGDTVTDTATDTDGSYIFQNLVPGSYKVHFTKPDGSKFTVQKTTDTDKNSDADENGDTASVTLASGENNTTVDAGIYSPAKLGDYVWNDENRNGVQDAGEEPVESATVKLYSAGPDGTAYNADDTLIGTQTTDANGNYLFEDLNPGKYYTVFFAEGNIAFTAQDSGSDDALDSDADENGRTAAVQLKSGDDITTVDAGIYHLAQLGDTVWEDKNYNGLQDSGEPGVANVTVRLLDATGNAVTDKSGKPVTTVTDANGKYLFGKLVPGTYGIGVDKPAAYAGFTVQDAKDTTLPDSDAQDSDVSEAAGVSQSVALAADEINLTMDAGLYKLGSLGSYVWFDSNKDGLQNKNEKGIAGVTVYLYDAQNKLLGKKVTDKDGKYMFTELKPGKYYAVFVPPAGYIFTKENQSKDGKDDSKAAPSGETVEVNLASGAVYLYLDAGVVKGTAAETATYFYDSLVWGLGFLAVGLVCIGFSRKRKKHNLRT